MIFAQAIAYWISFKHWKTASLGLLISHSIEKTTSMTFHFDKNYFC